MSASPFGFGPTMFGSPSPEELARALAVSAAGMPTGFSGAPSIGLPQMPGVPMTVRPQSMGGAPAPFTVPPNAGLPEQAQAAPQRRAPLSFGAPQRTAAPTGSMTVPLPPSRPAEFQASQVDMPAEGAQAIMSAAQTEPPAAEGPSFLDRVMGALRQSDGLATSLGIGLMSTPGFGQGLASGFKLHQDGEGRRAASRLAQAEYGLKANKLAQEQGGRNQTRSWLIGLGTDPATVDGAIAASQAGRPEALANLVNNASPKQPDAPSGYRLNPDGSAAYIRGGPQDPAMREAEAAASARGTASAKSPDDFSLSPGQVRYSADGRPIASARSDKPENFDTESKLRGEFSKGLGTFADVHDGYGRVIAATQERERNPTAVSPASDMSLVFGFMKMLDPTSVVREGEYATAKNAAGIPDQFRNAYNKAVDGEFLTPQQRQDFVNQSAALYGKARSNAEGVAERYRGLASQYGVDPGRSVYLPEMPKPPQITGGRASDQGGALGVGGTRDMGGGITVRRVR